MSDRRPYSPDAFRAARQSAGLTQWGLAERIGRRQSNVSQIERGINRDVPLSLAAAWARACGVTVDSLIENERS